MFETHIIHKFDDKSKITMFLRPKSDLFRTTDPRYQYPTNLIHTTEHGAKYLESIEFEIPLDHYNLYKEEKERDFMPTIIVPKN
jgi:hypothetical protein